MKKIISAMLCFCMLMSIAPAALAAETAPRTLRKGVLGTLRYSGIDYEAELTIPGYLGQVKTELTIDGETEKASVSVVRISGDHATVKVELKPFDGTIYNANLEPVRYDYTEGEGFADAGPRGASGKSSQKGGSLDLGSRGGLFSGRIRFYYSLEDLNYRSIDSIPIEKWTELFYFDLGVDYVLALTDQDVKEVMEKGTVDGFFWPGLRELLGKDSQLSVFADGSFENFKDVNHYENGTFPDISTQWYAPYVARSYAVNLMRGNTNGTFYAEGNVTVAEAITIAARLHNIYYGDDGMFTQGRPWYQVYADYAVAQDMIKDDTFDDYERPITRKEMASLLSKAVELTRLERINAEIEIPDIDRDDEDYAAIQALYACGILTGSKADGRFLPEDDIVRAEAAAMIARLVTPELRVKKAE